MLYAIVAHDKPDALDIRLDTRQAHLAYLDSLGDDLVAAGPFLDAEEQPCGSLVIFKAESMAAAETIAARDPYAEAGLFATVEVKRWNWAINAPKEL